jgi:hypothetical protein
MRRLSIRSKRKACQLGAGTSTREAFDEETFHRLRD